MTIKIDDTTESMIAVLTALTGHKFGDNEMPVPAPAEKEAYVIVYNIPGGTTYGSMAGELENASAIFQLTYVGHTNSQCRKLQQKIETALELSWLSIAGCMGPARIAIGGIVKEDERTFVANDTLYMEITG
jgi:hypothetical protein